MLIPKIEIDTKAADGTLVVIKDATGEYSEANPNGYGAPNDLRANLRGGLLVSFHSNGEESTTIYSPTSINATSQDVASWDLAPLRDGYYQIFFILAPVYSIHEDVSQNGVRYYNGTFYKAIEAAQAGEAITNTYFWEPITKPSDYPILAVETGAYFAALDYLHTVYSELAIANRYLAFVENQEVESVNALRNYVLIDSRFKAANYQAGFGKFDKAGEEVDELVELLTSNNTEY